ncbi:MAG: GtrA family protein [Thomasclavelia sp.]|nr:GtrA family protein [Thomasclavelia sp.]
MKNILNKYQEIISYLFFGVLTTLVSIISFYVFNLVFNWMISNVISWVFAVTFAYYTNKLYVFKSKTHNDYKEIFSFFCSRLFSLLVDMVVMIILIDLVKINPNIAKIFDQFIIVVINYILSKCLVFNKGGVHLGQD